MESLIEINSINKQKSNLPNPYYTNEKLSQIMRELFVILAVACFNPQLVSLKKYFTSPLSPPCEGGEERSEGVVFISLTR